jgi:hypothetical protein
MYVSMKRLTLFVLLMPPVYAGEYICYPETQTYCEGNEARISCQTVERRQPGYIRSMDIDFDKPALKSTAWVGGTYEEIEKEVLKVNAVGSNKVITFKSSPLSISHLSMANDQFKMLHNATLPSPLSYHLVTGSCEEKCGTCS